MAVIIRNRQELINHVADITGRRDVITDALEALDNWQGLTPSQQAATEKMLNLPTTTEPEPEPEPVAPARTRSPFKPYDIMEVIAIEEARRAALKDND